MPISSSNNNVYAFSIKRVIIIFVFFSRFEKEEGSQG